MALITFQDLPSTNTPINSANLNNNFNELNNKIPTYGKAVEYSGQSVSTFQNWLINTAVNGSYIVNLYLNGAYSCAIVQKANNNYLSFIHFGYGIGPRYYKYLTGVWTDLPLYE